MEAPVGFAPTFSGLQADAWLLSYGAIGTTFLVGYRSESLFFSNGLEEFKVFITECNGFYFVSQCGYWRMDSTAGFYGLRDATH